MLGKLMTYELRALWKPAAIMLAIMVVAGIAGTACLGATRAISEVPWGAYGSLAAPTAGNATVVLFMGALFCAFLVWAAVVAFYVFSGLRLKKCALSIIHCLYRVGMWNSFQSMPDPYSSGAPSSRPRLPGGDESSPSTWPSVGMTRSISAGASGASVCM